MVFLFPRREYYSRDRRFKVNSFIRRHTLNKYLVHLNFCNMVEKKIARLKVMLEWVVMKKKKYNKIANNIQNGL